MGPLLHQNEGLWRHGVPCVQFIYLIRAAIARHPNILPRCRSMSSRLSFNPHACKCTFTFSLICSSSGTRSASGNQLGWQRKTCRQPDLIPDRYSTCFHASSSGKHTSPCCVWHEGFRALAPECNPREALHAVLKDAAKFSGLFNRVGKACTPR